MADTTQTIQLGTTPIEIVATLNLPHGEYRIENSEPPTLPSSTAIIRFLTSPTQPDFTGSPETWGGHALAVGAREDIGIKTGSKWYFWSLDNATLIITKSEAGGAIGGSPPIIRHPSFHVDIFRVLSRHIGNSNQRPDRWILHAGDGTTDAAKRVERNTANATIRTS